MDFHRFWLRLLVEIAKLASLWNYEDLWRMLASFRKIGYAVYGE